MRTRARNLWLGMLGAACLLAAGCPSCNPLDLVLPPPTEVASITVFPGNADLTVGQRQQFTVTVLPANVKDKDVTWSATPESAGTIDKNGLFTSRAAGSATVTAKSVATPAITGTASATITAAPVTAR